MTDADRANMLYRERYNVSAILDEGRPQEQAPRNRTVTVDASHPETTGVTPDVQEVVERLLQAGYDPTTLSSALEMPLDDVIALVPPERRKIAAADAQLANAMRVLAWRTIEEAMMILDEGSPMLKIKLIQKLSGDLARTISVSDKDEMEDLRKDFRELMSGVKDNRE